MSKNTWDAVLASSPLNATAATVTSKGYDYSPPVTFSETVWDAPPPMTPVGRMHLANASFVDLTGRRVGRLTVLGIARDNHRASGSGGGLWVCRCSCGRYVGRRAKSLKAASAEAMCNECDYTRKLREAASGDRARQRAESEKARKW